MSRFLAILGTLFVVWVVVLANLGLINDYFPFIQSTPFFDKAGHFCLMGGLAFLVNLTLQGRRFRLLGLSIYLGSMIVLICVAAEELSQAFISTRSFDLSDLAADSLGIFILGALGGRLGASRRHTSSDATRN